jgi:D-xylose transport system ATP-binding protein
LGSSQQSAAPLVEARGITKRFPGVTALSDVSFTLRAGEVHALCGENGAGKSTLIKLLSGIHPHGSYEGELAVDGRPARFKGVADAERSGIAVITQELALVPAMTAAENLFLGVEPTRWGLVDRDAMRREALELFKRFGLSLDPDVRVEELGVGQRQMLEILKAIRKRSKVLILDEPTAALSEAEARSLAAAIKDLRARGLALVYISHRLEEVFDLSDRITVLRDGATVTTLKTAETSRAEVIRHMVGRDIHDLFPRRASVPGEALLSVRSLSADGPDGRPVLKGVSFDARAGEVVGIGGLMGAGRTELLMHVFASWGRRTGGTVHVEGKALAGGGPRAAMAAGLALVSEDRRRWGLFLGQSVGFNMSLSHLDFLSRWGLVDREAEAAENGRYFSSLRVKAPTLAAGVAGLSGGNQQKVVFGRALMPGPRVVLLDEPTRGVDVGAKVEMYEIVNRLTEQGLAVVLVSSELPELLGMSDRILMLRGGEVAGEFPRGATQEALIAAAIGHKET